MNPIEIKHNQLIKILQENNLQLDEVIIDNQTLELRLSFMTDNLNTADLNIIIHPKLKEIFDFSTSISVNIESRNHDHLKASDINFEKNQESKLEESISKRLKQAQPMEKKMVKTHTNSKKTDLIFGKSIGGVTKPMSEIDHAQGEELAGTKINVKGQIIDIKQRICKNKKIAINFEITDYTSTIACQLFRTQEETDELLSQIKKEQWIQVEGSLAYDNFKNQIYLKPFAAGLSEETKRLDEAPEKRVELHLHSQYSTMDAVSKVKKIIKQAIDFQHDAIGITDHGVVQAYPEMMNYTKGKNIKVLYGVEGYLVDDGENIVTGTKEEDLLGEYIFFDLETTGLIPGKDVIIEIAATKIKNKQIIDTFSCLVNPHRKLSQKIVELTHITDDMLLEGKEIENAIEEFLEFCQDHVLIAHNAKFDMGFIRTTLKNLGIEKEFTVIDTLAMARAILPTLNTHRLKKLATHYKIPMGQHHRALDDSICSSKIFFKLVEAAQNKEVFKLSELNGLLSKEQLIKTSRPYHVIIYAKNQKGIRDLYEMISKSHVDYFYRKPRIPKSYLNSIRENFLIGSACEVGELYTAIKENASSEKIEELANFYDYYEVQPLGNNEFMVESGMLTRDDLIENNKKIIELGKKHNKLVVATGDVHFVDPGDAIFREILQTGQGFGDAKKQPPLYYRSTQEMLDEFDYLSKDEAYEIVVTNTRRIADIIEDVQPIPSGTFPPVIAGSDQEIREMVYKKAEAIYGTPLPEVVDARITKELDSIIGNGYSVLYLIAQKLVYHSNEEGYLVGSRGSVGSSLVAMLCGITEVNSLAPHYICPECHYFELLDSTKVGVGPDLPEKACPKCQTNLNRDGFDIPFETFLGFKGDKEPDIDLNFSGENQSEAHRYTEVLFGEGKVYRAGTISTLADRTAYGYVKNYFDEKELILPEAEMNRMIKGCEGIKKTTGQHPGGIMVVPKDKEIYEFTPIQYPADDKESGTFTTHFDYHSIEGRLLKLDILGHDDPTMLKMLKNLTGVDPQMIPLDDQGVLSLFLGTEALKFVEEGFHLPLGTCGVPEFGTSFVREMVKESKPTSFSDLVRISGLSHGTNVWINNAQELIKNKTATIKEVICTRDDIMVGLIAMGLEEEQSFKIMEDVRKGKGLRPDQEEIMKLNNVPNWYMESCKKISYMFPKAHAVAYVIMAFRIAYYKVYYPLAYYATYFSIRAKEFNLLDMTGGINHIKKTIDRFNFQKAQGQKLSNKELQSLVSLELALEMNCRGFEFSKIDIYQSHHTNYLIKDNRLLPPLEALEGLGEKVAKQIYDEARVSPFISKEDFQNRAKVNKTNMEKLEAHGCLKDLPNTNQLSFF